MLIVDRQIASSRALWSRQSPLERLSHGGLYTNDLLTSITDANGNVTGYAYDALKRLQTTTFPDGATEGYTYHPDGLLATKTDRNGVTVTYTYDHHKRLESKSYSSGGSVGFTYQGQKLTQVQDSTTTPAETHMLGYDATRPIEFRA